MQYGHQFGLCYIKDNFAYIPIHKNASTWVINYLTCMGWKQSNISKLNNNYTFLVVLRKDIVKRWVSGMCEVFFKEYNDLHLLDNANFIASIFKQITYECHTDTQKNLIGNISLSKTIFFDLGDKFSTRFINYLRVNNQHVEECISNNAFINSSAMFKLKHIVIEKFFNYASLPLNNAQLKMHFKEDYKLLENVTFYA